VAAGRRRRRRTGWSPARIPRFPQHGHSGFKLRVKAGPPQSVVAATDLIGSRALGSDVIQAGTGPTFPHPATAEGIRAPRPHRQSGAWSQDNHLPGTGLPKDLRTAPGAGRKRSRRPPTDLRADDRPDGAPTTDGKTADPKAPRTGGPWAPRTTAAWARTTATRRGTAAASRGRPVARRAGPPSLAAGLRPINAEGRSPCAR
jgi:hypothetical protein